MKQFQIWKIKSVKDSALYGSSPSSSKFISRNFSTVISGKKLCFIIIPNKYTINMYSWSVQIGRYVNTNMCTVTDLFSDFLVCYNQTNLVTGGQFASMTLTNMCPKCWQPQLIFCHLSLEEQLSRATSVSSFPPPLTFFSFSFFSSSSSSSPSSPHVSVFLIALKILVNTWG